jgi:hypothetical protein
MNCLCMYVYVCMYILIYLCIVCIVCMYACMYVCIVCIYILYVCLSANMIANEHTHSSVHSTKRIHFKIYDRAGRKGQGKHIYIYIYMYIIDSYMYVHVICKLTHMSCMHARARLLCGHVQHTRAQSAQIHAWMCTLTHT